MLRLALSLLLFSVCLGAQDAAAIEATLTGWKAKRPEPRAGTRVSETKQVEEDYADYYMRYEETKTKISKRLEELVLHDNSASSIFPGALLWTQPLLAGELVPMRELKGRPPVKVSFIGAEGAAPFEHDGTHAGFRQAYGQRVGQITKSTPAVSYKLYVGEDLNATLLEAGLSAKYWGAKLSTGFRKNVTSTESFAIVVLDQAYYNLAVDAPPPGGFAPVSLLAADAAASEYHAFMQAKGELGYVRRVTYGRRLVLAIDAKATKEAVKRSLNFSYNSGTGSIDGQVTDEDRRTWSSMSLTGVVIGGSLPGDVTADLLTGPRDRFLENLNKFLKATLVYSQDASGAVVSFEVAYASDDMLVASYETTDYSGRDGGKRLRKAGTVHATDVRVSTETSHGVVVGGDSEIDTDDWTKVTMAYELRVAPDKRSIEAKFSWDALEGDKKQRAPKDTHIRSAKDWHSIWSLPPDDARLIERIEGAASASNDGHWYRGQVHGEVAYPGVGGLKSIFVTIDGRGRDDHKRQSMRALIDFAVYLDRER